MKKCPYCAEDIQDAAIKCKHCGEFLNVPLRTPVPQSPPAASIPWYYRTSSIVITLLCIPPLALPLIWLHPLMKPLSKAIWTLVTLALTWLTVLSIFKLLDVFHQLTEVLHGF